MKKALAIAGGLGLGAGLMYLLDPEGGRRRRALARDQFVGAAHDLECAAGKTARDMRNRSRGIAAEVGGLFRRDHATDEVVHDRVRSAMGRYVSHPGAIRVEVEDGHVILSGPILAREVVDLLDCVSRVKGVAGVEDRLEPHAEAGNVPALQGGRERTGERFELFQENWSPAARLVVGATGGALALYGASRRDAMGGVLGAIGVGLLARGAADLGVGDLFGLQSREHAVEIRKAIEIDAPVERVFEFWQAIENFPRFMSNVEEVRDLGGGRSHWRVKGPANVPVEWDARITRVEPNRLLAWESEPGSTVESCGAVRFQPGPNGGTVAEVRLSYTPPAGAVGHGVAAFFEADPRSEMDEDLQRMKALVEAQGRGGTLH